MRDPSKEEIIALKNINQLLLFPSWRKLINEEDFTGKYLGKPVLEVLRDNVLFLPNLVMTGENGASEEDFIFMTGVGLYYTQFRLSPGEIITDSREICGLILSLDDYEKAQDVSGSMIQSENIKMTELMVTVPFGLILAKQTTQMFLRGVIARNIIHPFKDCFNELVKLCENPNTLSLKEGLKILSGFSNSHNTILTEKKIEGYSLITAGLKEITDNSNQVIEYLKLNEENMKKGLFKKFRLMKKDFVDVGYPSLMDWAP
ncbi:MAG: hypothetical protein ACTSW1_09945 [Candidatus Hodarchaeales archaeon]